MSTLPLTLTDYFRDPQTGADRRDTHPTGDLPTIANYATDLLRRVNQLLAKHGLADAHVTSGWRPPDVAAHTPGAAPQSGHLTGRAIDLRDASLGITDANSITHITLHALVASRPDYLRDCGLWLEAPTNPAHVHLDTLMRGDRPTRVFHA